MPPNKRPERSGNLPREELLATGAAPGSLRRMGRRSCPCPPGLAENYNCARPHAGLDKQPPMSRFRGATTSCSFTTRSSAQKYSPESCLPGFALPACLVASNRATAAMASGCGSRRWSITSLPLTSPPAVGATVVTVSPQFWSRDLKDFEVSGLPGALRTGHGLSSRGVRSDCAVGKIGTTLAE